MTSEQFNKQMTGSCILNAVCSRCKKDTGSPLPDGSGMTAGYYVAAVWIQFTNPNEEFICDHCMWSDPRYIAVYGKQPE